VIDGVPIPLLTSFLLLLISARILGNISKRLGQPDILGEMLAGIVLGPALLNLVHANEALSGISELAVFLIILSAGLEMSYKDIMLTFRGKGLLVAIISFLIPFGSSLILGNVFELDAMRIIFVALTISITALPVTIRILESFGILEGAIARYSVAGAIVNDILALLILGVILNLPESRDYHVIGITILGTVGKLLLLMMLITLANYALVRLEKTGVRIHRGPEFIIKIFGDDALLGIVIIFVLIFGSVSELLGFHFVIGAFFGSLLISKDYFISRRYVELEKTINSMTRGFLAPLFFAYLGLEFTLNDMRSLPFVVAVILVSIFSKIIAGWIGGKIVKLSSKESLGLGVILNGRGVMGLVVAQIGLQNGFIGRGLFSILVLMGIFTTMITPILFKWVWSRNEPNES
jgi:Kef-type K+ transport system membrane component KefB